MILFWVHPVGPVFTRPSLAAFHLTPEAGPRNGQCLDTTRSAPLYLGPIVRMDLFRRFSPPCRVYPAHGRELDFASLSKPETLNLLEHRTAENELYGCLVRWY